MMVDVFDDVIMAVIFVMVVMTVVMMAMIVMVVTSVSQIFGEEGSVKIFRKSTNEASEGLGVKCGLRVWQVGCQDEELKNEDLEC